MTKFCLVVEDESPLGEMIRDNLVADGLDADLVKDGAVALNRIQRGGLDLVVLDVMLPGMTGFEVLQEMRAQGDDTPVLILSARAADEDRIRGLELRADDYLTKPFVLRELLLRVRALLRRAPAPADNRGHALRRRDRRTNHGSGGREHRPARPYRCDQHRRTHDDLRDRSAHASNAGWPRRRNGRAP